MAFYSLTDGDDRYHSICRACRAAGHQENPEILKEYEEAGIKSKGGWMEPAANFKPKYKAPYKPYKKGGNYARKY